MLLRLRTTIESKVLSIHHFEEVSHDIHNLCHLEEDESLEIYTRSINSFPIDDKTYSVTSGRELGEDARQ